MLLRLARMIGIVLALAIPLVDLAGETSRQVVVDREPGQYLGHPTTVLLEDGRTILCVYPKGHGKGAIVSKRSEDGGKTWSGRLPTPASWATSLETPTIYRTVDRGGKKRGCRKRPIGNDAVCVWRINDLRAELTWIVFIVLA